LAFFSHFLVFESGGCGQVKEFEVSTVVDRIYQAPAVGAKDLDRNGFMMLMSGEGIVGEEGGGTWIY
jgi:hypothetical protein